MSENLRSALNLGHQPAITKAKQQLSTKYDVEVIYENNTNQTQYPAVFRIIMPRGHNWTEGCDIVKALRNFELPNGYALREESHMPLDQHCISIVLLWYHLQH